MVNASYVRNIDSSGNGFDRCIRKAIEMVKKYPDIIPPISHILIDEAQDIDDLRVELLLVLHEIKKIPMTICGDPRQRLSGSAGRWFADLWKDISPVYLQQPLNVKKFGIQITHRFKSQFILDVVNRLSELRLDIHVPLRPHIALERGYENIDCYLTGNDNEEDQMRQLICSLKCFFDDGKDVIVCSLSKDKQNKTSQYIRRFYSLCKSEKIPCWWDTETQGEEDHNNYLPKGIRFSTSHSTKGSEADVVVLVGVTPDRLSNIPEDEAQSINFVSHSRARERIIYLAKAYGYHPPKGIPNDILKYKTLLPINVNDEEQGDLDVHYSLSDIAKERSFATWKECNNLVHNEISERLTIPPIKKPACLSDNIWGTIFHVAVQIHLTRKFPKNFVDLVQKNFQEVTKKEFNKLCKHHAIVNSRDQNGRLIICQNRENAPNSQEIDYCKQILEKQIEELNWKDLKYITQMLCWLLDTSMSSRHDIPDDISLDMSLFENIAKCIKNKFGSCLETETPTKFNCLVGMIDALFEEDIIIEFKAVQTLQEQHVNQLILYGLSKMHHDSKKYTLVLLNLSSGEYKYIEIQDIRSYVYSLSKYLTVHHHINNFDREFKYSTPKRNMWIVDTEYANFSRNPFSDDVDKICEIAIVSLDDPYRSVVSLVKMNNPKWAVEWLNKHRSQQEDFLVRESDITNAPLLKDVVLNWKKIVQTYDPNEKPTLCYYHSQVDISWCESSDDAITLDIAINALTVAKKNGCFIKEGQPPKLGDLYRNLAVNPGCSLLYLSEHTAFSDVLFLYELIKTGVFSCLADDETNM